MSVIVDKIKSYPITSIVQKFVTLKRDSIFKMKGCCPFHKEKTPSFFVDDKEGFYKCFGCDAGGDVITFIQNIKNCDFKEAIDYLCGEFGIKYRIEEDAQSLTEKTILDVNLVVCEYYKEQIFKKENFFALKYFEKQRNISLEIIKEFHLGYANDNIDGLIQFCAKRNILLSDLLEAGIIKEYNGKKSLFFKNRVIFPIFFKNKILAFGGRVLNNEIKPKYLNSSENIFFKKKDILYNFTNAKKYKEHNNNIIVVEGYMDVIALSKVAIRTAVAPLGTSMTSNHINMILNIDSSPIFCFDTDEAGRMAAFRTAKLSIAMLKTGIIPRFLTINDAKDIDELIEKNTKNINLLLKNSVEIHEFLFLEFLKKYDIRNPNSKTQLENELKLLFEEIQDNILKKNYLFWIKNRIWKEILDSSSKKSINVPIEKNIVTIEDIEKKIVDFLQERPNFELTDEFYENILPNIKINLQAVNFDNIIKNEYNENEISEFNNLINQWKMYHISKLSDREYRSEMKKLIDHKFQ